MVRSSCQELLDSMPNLANVFQGSMIRLPYRHRIIPLYKWFVQTLLLAPFTSGIAWLGTKSTDRKSYISFTTVQISYLLVGTALLSYLAHTTVPKSYLRVEAIGWRTQVFLGFLLLPLIGLANTDNSSTTTLADYEEDPDHDEQNEILSDSIDQNIESDTNSSIRAYGYARQSQSYGKDVDESGDTASIKSQKANILETAKEHDLAPVKIFTDVNESGFSFDRDGLNDLDTYLDNYPRPIILDRINRLGRDTLETIYVAAKLHFLDDVPIITHRYGKYELGSTTDQIHLVVEAITAGKSVEDRIRAAWNSIYQNFKEEGSWLSWFDNVRLGHKLPDDASWPVPAEGGDAVITALMHDTIELQQYSGVANLLEDRAENKTLETHSQNDLLIPELDASTIRSVFEHSDIDLDKHLKDKIKRIVTDPVYIGKVRYPRWAPPEEQSIVEDDDLQLVDEELFEEVNEVVEQITEVTSSVDETVDVPELADLGLLVEAIEGVDEFKPVCSHCGRGMTKNGTDLLNDGQTAHYWICPQYGEDSGDVESSSNEDTHSQLKFPANEEWDTLKDYLESDSPESSDIVVLRVCPMEAES